MLLLANQTVTRTPFGPSRLGQNPGTQGPLLAQLTVTVHVKRFLDSELKLGPKASFSGVNGKEVLGSMVHFLNYVERLLVVVGAILLATYLGFLVDRSFFSQIALEQFALASGSPAHSAGKSAQFPIRNMNQWSSQRIAAYERAVSQHFGSPMAILRITRLGLQVPVLEGTDELALNRGVGHISGTVAPGEFGNIGIAGHRDGFFRVLKDVVVGDTIEVDLHDRIDFYRVTKMFIVNRKDVSVLRSHSISSLTLVTCYPFFFLGSAPKRFIVQATRVGSVSVQTADARFSSGILPPRSTPSQVPESVEKMKEITQ